LVVSNKKDAQVKIASVRIFPLSDLEDEEFPQKNALLKFKSKPRKKGLSSNHLFSGTMLNFGEVLGCFLFGCPFEEWMCCELGCNIFTLHQGWGSP